jgi:hypothetical protein
MIEILQFEGLYNCIMKTFVFIIILVILLSLFILYYNNSGNNPVLINKITSADKSIQINNKIKLSKFNNGLTWSIITWLYIDDWNYKYGRDKYILRWTDYKKNGFEMYFDKKNNSLKLSITTIPLMQKETLIFDGIPLQKWINIIVILDNRSLDLFIDGELVKTKKLEYVPFYINNNLTLFPDGGFSGKVGYLQYMNNKIPQFGIQHFQLLRHKMVGNIPFYTPLFYSILYAFKYSFYNIILVFDRTFKHINYLTLEMVTEFIEILRQTFNDILLLSFNTIDVASSCF